MTKKKVTTGEEMQEMLRDAFVQVLQEKIGRDRTKLDQIARLVVENILNSKDPSLTLDYLQFLEELLLGKSSPSETEQLVETALSLIREHAQAKEKSDSSGKKSSGSNGHDAGA